MTARGFRMQGHVIQDQALRTVADALQNQTVVEFVCATVKAGYREFYGAESDRVCGMVEKSFDELASSQQDGINTEKLVAVTSDLLEHTFRKADSSFWFNRIYHQYKIQTKPETDFQQLQKLLDQFSAHISQQAKAQAA